MKRVKPLLVLVSFLSCLGGAIAEDATDCAMAPYAQLAKLHLKKYQTKTSSAGALTESADLGDGVAVTLAQSGCEALRSSYSFRFADDKTALDQIKHWLELGAKQFDKLKDTEEAGLLRKLAQKKKGFPFKDIPVNEIQTMTSATLKREKSDVILTASFVVNGIGGGI
jgi:hypothetical protein